MERSKIHFDLSCDISISFSKRWICEMKNFYFIFHDIFWINIKDGRFISIFLAIFRYLFRKNETELNKTRTENFYLMFAIFLSQFERISNNGHLFAHFLQFCNFWIYPQSCTFPNGWNWLNSWNIFISTIDTFLSQISNILVTFQFFNYKSILLPKVLINSQSYRNLSQTSIID